MQTFINLIFIIFREIWNRFLEFESNIGDLSSILKVEKRRTAVFGKVIYKKLCTDIKYKLIFEFSWLSLKEKKQRNL